MLTAANTEARSGIRLKSAKVRLRVGVRIRIRVRVAIHIAYFELKQ